MLKWLACVALLLVGESTNAQERGTAERWKSLYEPQVFEGMPCRVMTPLGFDTKQS
jgi:hypothetical protein